MLNKELLFTHSTSSSQGSADLITPTSRDLYRHSSGCGTVIEFDMYGTWTKLFVPDAKYRSSSTAQWGGYDTNISAITDITNSNFYITGSSYSRTSILTPIPTDDELQSRLSLSSIQSAKTCTDAMISSIGSSTSYAAGLARSCYISGLGYMDLPNIYELMVCWCEADNIDNMDPTVEDYPSLKIGYTHSSGRFRNYYFWSSSECSGIYAWLVYYNGYAGRIITKYYRTYYVLPVLEL